MPMRSTPTRVGTFSGRRNSCSRRADHPHTRGDIVTFGNGKQVTIGPPPHAWGHCFRLEKVRSTLAVHPHTRGDIRKRALRQAYPFGPPPHAWGHFQDPLLRLVRLRSTP